MLLGDRAMLIIIIIIIIIHAFIIAHKIKEGQIIKSGKSSNQRRSEEYWLEGESRGEQVWFQLFFKAINRCAGFDSARQGVPNCGASYPETTRAKTGSYKRSDKSMSTGGAQSSCGVVWLNEWRQIWRGSWVKWFVCKQGYLVLYAIWNRKPMEVFQQRCCTGARLWASYYLVPGVFWTRCSRAVFLTEIPKRHALA